MCRALLLFIPTAADFWPALRSICRSFCIVSSLNKTQAAACILTDVSIPTDMTVLSRILLISDRYA